jgi:hypothetical protein
LRRLPHESTLDRVRAARLLDLRDRHAGEKIVAFSQFSDTASMYYRSLRSAGHVCQLDGRGAQVAGGRLSRREALARFAPRATGSREPPTAHRIDVLIATDLLSEGVNLQDASVVVHLDLPWTPARLEQRVGRSRRLGARHALTTVYVMSPPATSETLLRQEQRLHAKMQTAARLTGACGAILPARLSPPPASLEHTGSPAPARAMQLVRARLRTWLSSAPTLAVEGAVRIACVRGSAPGALALVRRADRPALIAMHGARTGEDPADVLAAAHLAAGDDVPWSDAAVTHAVDRIEAWIASSDGAAHRAHCRAHTPPPARSRCVARCGGAPGCCGSLRCGRGRCTGRAGHGPHAGCRLASRGASVWRSERAGHGPAVCHSCFEA